MDNIDFRFINSLSVRLKNFKQKGSKYVCSCPLCGDSHKDKRKARLYFYEKDGKLLVYCFNECGGMSFYKFLERFDQALLNEYRSEKFFKSRSNEEIVIKEIEKKKDSSYDDQIFTDHCIRCSELSDFSDIKQYLLSRRIPEEYVRNIFYANKFKEFVNFLIPNKIEGKEESRIIIPFFDENKKIFAFSARSLDKKSDLRYVNIVLDETKPKLFGLDRWDKNKKTYVVEGAFDAMFIDNTLATGGGDIISAISQFPKENFVVVYDNEPRSQSTKKKIEKAINNGYKVCIWPKSILFKDINKMIQEKIKPLDIKKIIDHNTFCDLEAKLALGD